MNTIDDIIKNNDIILYGIGIETERILTEWNGRYTILGLLDGFRNDGEIFGYPILDINDVAKYKNIVIIVIARPGSCKAIAKRIGDFCRTNKVALYDIRGKNLLDEAKVVYTFAEAKPYTRKELLHAASEADIVSFDIFDTILVRDIAASSDVFELVNARLREMGIDIPDFEKRRLAAEKELSNGAAPRLDTIYSKVLEGTEYSDIDVNKLVRLEYDTDNSLLITRVDMLDVLRAIKAMGKEVWITSESYYNLEQIHEILKNSNIIGVDRIFVSCEYNRSKASGLFDELRKCAGKKKILHIGDDLTADVEAAKRSGIEGFRIYSTTELLDILGGLDIENKVYTLSDKIKLGMFKSAIFNSPFQFEDDKAMIHVDSSKDVGYLFCAPIITDFCVWFDLQVKEKGIDEILFCSRDGYLLNKFYKKFYPERNPHYFLTSRISAIRAGVENKKDIAYVDSMKFSGTVEDNLRTRFGIDALTVDDDDIDGDAIGLKKYSRAILKNAEEKKNNNLKYIESLNLKSGKVAIFDFVAKGTSQFFIQRLLSQDVEGLYFLQMEPEFMKDKGLKIISFYTEEEREQSAIFDNYYIIETLLTSPDPSVDEFDEMGKPVYVKETRTEKDISCFMKAQEGIVKYVEKFLSICPRGEIKINKALDEAMLVLLHNIQIRDNDFLDLKVEDPFFNRMTDITDVL